MKTSLIPLPRLFTRHAVLFVFGAALGLATRPAVAVPAVDAPATQPLADKAAKLPVSSSFEKEKSGDNKGLYTLSLKNTSASALTVTATIQESVVSHNRPKTRTLPAQAIEPGKTWKIDGLAAQDKITLTATGFEALELTAP